MPARILIVDDEANIRRMLAALLRAEGYHALEAATGMAALEAAGQSPEPDAVLLDLMMPGLNGLETLARLKDRLPDVPVVMMSGQAQIPDAVQATRLGAFQFLEKPLSPDAVLATLRAALELTSARMANRALAAALTPQAELVGDSVAMRKIRETIAQVAPTDARVLISGESGTGKELVAAAIHRASRRSTKPFITVNCAAIPRELVESEMFGHERGAFTGATDRRLGRFALAHGGTLFLDEVGDLHLEAQAKLLRTLETGEIQRLGAEGTERVDVRVIAATNRRLEEAVADRSFREDLYFRLNVLPIHVPPLRERIEDLPALVEHLARRVRPANPPVFTPGALAALMAHPWPGNVRELANIVERLAILGGSPLTEEAVIPVLRPVRASGAAAAPSAPALPTLPLGEALDAYERDLIARALAISSGNIAAAARLLQTDRPNLYRRMRRLGLGDGESERQ
ncbi:MAG: sigma-54-dependent transcriptional regulator [Gemmatimonadota bacterium]